MRGSFLFFFLNADKLSLVPHTIITGIENDRIKRNFIDWKMMYMLQHSALNSLSLQFHVLSEIGNSEICLTRTQHTDTLHGPPFYLM